MKESREHLYGAIRKVMMRRGFLASHYSFKVLSIDVRTAQFVVMIDLNEALPDQRLFELEASIREIAKSHYGVLVQSIYWRGRDLVVSATESPQKVRLQFEQNISPVHRNVSDPEKSANAHDVETGFADTEILDDVQLGSTQYASL